MPTIEITIPDETACDNCETLSSIDINFCPKCGANTYRLPFGAFFGSLEQFRIMDARYGGLILGRNDAEDDIPMYVCREGGVYHLVGMMQGGEYIMSRAASVKFGPRLEEMNSERGNVGEISFPLTSVSSVINTNFMPRFGGLWILSNQFVINRYATMKYFSELERMNYEANSEHAALAEEGDGAMEA
ncbi:zinc ribbon domain-containing protein [Agrobacterium cavarae]|uniref:zinc ribbon domain-containing protein n=1 Tax=Agrobacterium cavarae TaxID=2528239 RepID=UPI00289942AD|nr:zinc ribbon domain-containing protein [Agrobacterium cavarae]